ncbi:MAG: SusC/RagA family TonB-linked outer membrane protein [Bacteroidetes bacterium]|nr:SusC/RagA family TonB-linked outer membrane protein [Bacteroidota bacterium]
MRKTTQKIPKILAVAFLYMLFALPAWAQNVITGNVNDSKTGAGVPNVTVTVKGTRISTQTDANGAFRINAPANASTLVFTSVGYALQEASIAGKTSVSIQFVQTDTKLDEVVVVAYGTRKKTDLTGAVTQVSAKDFQKGNIASSEQLLQGKVAGLEVTTGGGSAGGGSKIRIRGGASLNGASNDPLIVVDGVPVEGNNLAGSANYLNTINPDDVESVSVLRDAASTASYGSRASNGVIIITTKKGSRGKTRFNYNTQLSLSRVNNYVDVLSADEIRSVVNAEAASTGINTWKNLLGNANTDWQKLIYRNAKSINNNISATGSWKYKNFTLPYRISLGYLYQEGVLKTNKFDRFSTAVNLSPKFFGDHLSVNVNFKYTHTQNRFADEGAVGAAVAFDPTQYAYNNNPKTGGYFEWMENTGIRKDLATRNPLSLLNLRDNTSRVNRMIGNVQLDYKLHFFPDLHIQANLGLDNAGGIGNDIVSDKAASAFSVDGSGRRTHYEEKKRNYLAEISLFYEKNLGKNSKIDILALHGYQDFYTLVTPFGSYRLNGNIFPNQDLRNDKPQYRLESYLGKMNITLFNKYLLTGSIRRDATSKFSKDNRVGYFPAGAIAWKLKDEFFKNSNIVSELKLRFGYGVTGQQDGIAYYSYLPVYSPSSNTGAQYQFGDKYYTFLRPGAYNPDVKWEETATTNIGLDFGFAQNRISGSIEVYKKENKDLLFISNIPSGSNFDITLLSNIGKVENKGVEFAINLNPIRKKNLNWELGFNLTYNEAKITNLTANPDPNFKGQEVGGIGGGTGNYIGIIKVGEVPFSYLVYKQVYDPATGKPIEGLYEDLNRDGQITSDDRYIYKKPAPDFMYGFNTNITIKRFSLGLAGHGMIGNYLYNNYQSSSGVLNSIQNPINFIGNASANYFQTGFKNNRYQSDYYIQNASFLRLDNINLGYNFGDALRNKTNLRVSANVQNVFVITKYKGTDPENADNFGRDNNIYPRPTIYSIGASLDF